MGGWKTDDESHPFQTVDKGSNISMFELFSLQKT
jgi:hypothetical protein